MRPQRSGTAATALLFGVAAVVVSAAAQKSGDFHPPETPAERALDAIIRRVDSDRDVADNLLAGRGKPGFHASVDYATELTMPLLAAIAAAEKAIVQRDCGGRYIAGEGCGFDFIPVTCAQDSSDTYFYRNESESGTTATIAYTWRPDAAAVATFRLVGQAGRWKIDGVRCNSGFALNTP